MSSVKHAYASICFTMHNQATIRMYMLMHDKYANAHTHAKS